MRERIQNFVEFVGATMIATGVGLCFGTGAGLIAAGVLMLCLAIADEMSR